MIYKKFYGNVLVVDIDQSGGEELGDYQQTVSNGLFIPKQSMQKEDGYRTGTVLEVSEELKEEYTPGDKIQIVPIGREMVYEIKGTKVWRIPKQDVMGILTDETYSELKGAV